MNLEFQVLGFEFQRAGGSDAHSMPDSVHRRIRVGRSRRAALLEQGDWVRPCQGN